MSNWTPEQRRAHAAKLARRYYHTAKGKRREKVYRFKLFHPDWRLQPGPHLWTLKEDAALITYSKTTRQIAKEAGVTVPAASQRRVRIRRLAHTAEMHARISADQQHYLAQLRKKMSEIL